MTASGTWVAYGGAARIWLALALLIVAVSVAYAGTRLPLPIRIARPARAAGIAQAAGTTRAAGPGRRGIGLMIAGWIVVMAAFLAGVAAYVEREHHLGLLRAAPTDPIAPVTLIAAGLIFFIVLVSSPVAPGRRLVSAVVAAAAGPMIFEFPFDLIVMARTYPALPPDPAAYRALFFVPLFLVELSTLSFLTLSPIARLTRASSFAFALMLMVFAAWALTGFGYPSTPAAIAFNVASKLLAFVTVACLFLPPESEQPQPAAAPLPG